MFFCLSSGSAPDSIRTDLFTGPFVLNMDRVQRRAARWVLGDYSTFSSVTDMIGQLGRRNLEQRRSDSRLVLFYKIVYGYVAVPLPSNVIPLPRASRTSHPLTYRQISTRTDHYKYSFYPLTVIKCRPVYNYDFCVFSTLFSSKIPSTEGP